jgi:E3 ubiquitin-protein ligase Topors
VIHHIRSKYDYQKYFLTPLRTSPFPLQRPAQSEANRRPTRREREWGRRQRQEREEADQLQQSISKRRWVYARHLYAKVRYS